MISTLSVHWGHVEKYTKLCFQTNRILCTYLNFHNKEQSSSHLLCDLGCTKNFPLLILSIRIFSITVLGAKNKYVDSYELIPVKSKERGLLESEPHPLSSGRQMSLVLLEKKGSSIWEELSVIFLNMFLPFSELLCDRKQLTKFYYVIFSQSMVLHYAGQN